jgi:hypothetical protein
MMMSKLGGLGLINTHVHAIPLLTWLSTLIAYIYA